MFADITVSAVERLWLFIVDIVCLRLFDVLEEFADYLTLSSNLAGIATSMIPNYIGPCVRMSYVLLLLQNKHTFMNLTLSSVKRERERERERRERVKFKYYRYKCVVLYT